MTAYRKPQRKSMTKLILSLTLIGTLLGGFGLMATATNPNPNPDPIPACSYPIENDL